MKKIALAVSLILSNGILASSALAELYVGGRLGLNSLNNACHKDLNCDDDNFASGLHMGYSLNDHVSLEYGVDFLGNFEANFDNSQKSEVDGSLWAMTLAPKLNLPLSDSWNMFAKLGAGYIIAGDEKDVVPTGSVGAEFKLNYNWALRAEYQRYENMSTDYIDDMDSNFFGLGVNYKFGQEPQPVVAPEVKEEIEVRPVTKIVEHVHASELTTIQFEMESAEYTDAYELDNTVEMLAKYPQATVEVKGYSDSTGSSSYNLKLTEERAQVIAAALEAKGVESSRISAEGKGEENPVATNETREGRIMNRRVEVLVPEFTFETVEATK